MKELEFLENDSTDGELLSDRLAREPLAPEDAVRYAIEIGSALKLAQARGRVHGSLSPHSIRLTSNGARIVAPRPGDHNGDAYRAPEVVGGAEPDSLSDIFSYGAVLYEIAGGRPPFSGSGADLTEAICERQPAPLMAKSPALAAMESVIASCMQKDRARRRQRIHNAVIDLKAGRAAANIAELSARLHAAHQRPSEGPITGMRPNGALARESVRVIAQPRPARGRLITVLLAAALLLAAATALASMIIRHPKPGPAAIFPVSPPEHTTYRMPSLSPDGLNLTLSAVGKDGKLVLWLRRLDAMHPTVIDGTEGAVAPFWAPDSQSIGFFAGQSLKRIKLAGGPAQTICAADAMPGGGTWNRDGEVLFAPGQSGDLYKVAANGGSPQIALKRNAGRLERAFLWPQFLPDGKHFIFFVLTDLEDTTGVYTGEIGSSEYSLLFRSVTNAVFAPAGGSDDAKGYLLSIRDANLIGQSFHASKLALEGEPVLLVEDVGAVVSLSLAPISVSNNGILAYQSLSKPERQLVWMDRQGHSFGTASDGGHWGPPRISPDGSHALAAKESSNPRIADLWLMDRAGGVTQLTDEPEHQGPAVWSPDGSRIVFASLVDGRYDLFAKPATGGRSEPVYKSSLPKFPRDWSRDGKYLLMTILDPGTRADIWAYSMTEHRAAPVLNTVFMEDFPALSPDGKWLAYQSQEDSRNEIYVQPFEGLSDGTKRRWKVSTDGGALAHWRGDGQELFYITSTGRLMSVAVHPQGSEFAFDAPKFLFQTRPNKPDWNFYDVSPDGQAFIMNIPMEWSNASPPTVDTGWLTRINK